MIIRGPLGEELGWRGYLLNELNTRFSRLKSALITGIIWSVWHLPLWFISGYNGISLLLYCVFFTTGLVAMSVIMACIYSGRDRNLLYPILLHFMLNFTGRLFDFDPLVLLGASSGLYAVIAVISGFIMNRQRHGEAAAG